MPFEMDSGCRFRGTAGIEYWKPQCGEAFEQKSISVWGLGSVTVDSQRCLFQRSTAHLLQHLSLALNIYFTIQEERQEDFLCHTVIPPSYWPAQAKLFAGLIERAKLSHYIFFLAPITLLCIWNVCQNRKKGDADVFYLVFHLRLASCFQTELKQKATRV